MNETNPNHKVERKPMKKFKFIANNGFVINAIGPSLKDLITNLDLVLTSQKLSVNDIVLSEETERNMVK